MRGWGTSKVYQRQFRLTHYSNITQTRPSTKFMDRVLFQQLLYASFFSALADRD